MKDYSKTEIYDILWFYDIGVNPDMWNLIVLWFSLLRLIKWNIKAFYFCYSVWLTVYIKIIEWFVPILSIGDCVESLLATILWLWPFYQFFIHQIACPSNPWLPNLEIRLWCGIISKDLHKSRQTVSVAFPFIFITEGQQIGEVQSTLGKAVLILTYHFLACVLTRLPGEFLSLFLKIGSDISLFQLITDITWQPWLFRYDGEYLGNHINQFLQDLGMHVFSPHRFVHIRSREAVPNLLLSKWEVFCSPNPTVCVWLDVDFCRYGSQQHTWNVGSSCTSVFITQANKITKHSFVKGMSFDIVWQG